jgi:hypothetical protein
MGMIVTSEQLFKQLSENTISLDCKSDKGFGAYSGFEVIMSNVYPFECEDGTIVNGVMISCDGMRVFLVDASNKMLPFTMA